MSSSSLDDAFAHHVWATTRLIDTCLPLTVEQLGTTVPGTYGSIIETMRHLVGGDSDYLSIMTGDRAHLIDADEMDMPALRVRHRRCWVICFQMTLHHLRPWRRMRAIPRSMHSFTQCSTWAKA